MATPPPATFTTTTASLDPQRQLEQAANDASRPRDLPPRRRKKSPKEPRSSNLVNATSSPRAVTTRASEGDWRKVPNGAEEKFRSEEERRRSHPREGGKPAVFNQNRQTPPSQGSSRSLSHLDQARLHGLSSGEGAVISPEASKAGRRNEMLELSSRVRETNLNPSTSTTSSAFPPPPIERKFPPSGGSFPPPPGLHTPSPRNSPGPSSLPNRPESSNFDPSSSNLQPGQKKPPRQPHPRRLKREGPNGKPSNERRKEETDDEAYASSVDDSGEILSRFNAKGDNLSGEIMRLYETQRASPAALDARRYLISELCRILNGTSFNFGHSHNSRRTPLVIEAFGSVRFGLATSSSDLDLCLFDPYRPNGFDYSSSDTSGAPDSLPEIYDMRSIARILKRAGFHNVTPIPFAGVPIVKFEAKIRGETIQADLNTNERFGVLNSRLINAYCELHPYVRPLSVFVKFWARQRRLNDPSGSSGVTSFSSYTLILLVIAYLQTINLLPNLQSAQLIAEAGIEKKTFWTTPRNNLRGKKRTKSAVGWDVTFLEQRPRGWKAQEDNVTLEELAKGFFEFYSRDFNEDEWVVSVQNGEPFRRERPRSDLPVVLDKVTGGGNGAGALTVDERRQQDEDHALEAFAEEMEEFGMRGGAGARDNGTSTTKISTKVEDEERHRERMERKERAERSLRERDAMREREYEESRVLQQFVEPPTWTQKLIVQDPFLLTRNTATNVTPDVVEMLRIEMQRAYTHMVEGAPLSTVCASIKSEEAYRSFSQLRSELRKQRKKQKTIEKTKLDEGLPLLKDVDIPTLVEDGEVDSGDQAIMVGGKQEEVEKGEIRERNSQ